MFRKPLILALLVTGLLLMISPVLAGGWSVATLDSLPACVVAEEPLEIGFMVRQHGVHILDELKPLIAADHDESGEQFRVEAVADGDGHYTAELVFPVEGQWDWRFQAFGPDQPLPVLTVLPAGESCPDESEAAEEDDPAVLVEQGLALFVAKGCVVCHQHDAAAFDAFESINVGPELTDYQSEPDFLCRWLDNPTALAAKTMMPDLGLSGTEIESLIMFLNATEDMEAETVTPGWCGDLLASAVTDH
ncbi:MAG: hypothetical protein HY866_10385 [Chloroflexi bacterium]|nr:hypothetical protein [Chloroflexota bacterium]